MVASGSYTIKTAAGDYSTWAAACDDIENLTGDLTFTADASAFTENTAPAALTESLGGHTLTFTAATFPTTTDGTTGPRFTCNYADEFFYNQMEGSGNIITEGIVGLEGSSTPTYFFTSVFVNTGHTWTARRCVTKGGDYGFYHQDVDVTFNLYNNICMLTTNSAGAIRIGVNLTGHVSNNTIDEVNDVNRGIEFNSTSVTGLVENNIVYGPCTYGDFARRDGAEGNNNTSYDASCANANWATGANNRESQTADPFVDLGNQDYSLAAASDPIGNGKDLSGKFTTDFFGATRSTWDIGACYYSAGVDETVEPATLQLALTQETPGVVFPLQTALPDTLQLALTLETPAITAGIVIVPDTFALALTRHAPGFSLGHTVSIGAPLELALTLPAPAVTFPLQTVLPDTFALALALQTPVIITGDFCIVSVGSALELALAVEAPTILKNTLSWSAGLLTYKGVTYEISAGVTQKRFVYWDPNYTTVFRTTDVLQDVFDADGWVMCLNESGVAYPAFARKLIHGGIIQAGTITAAYGQIAALTVGGAELKDSAVSEAKLAALAVSEGKLAALSVSSAKIQALAVTSAKIGNLQVDSAKIANLTVGTGKITDDAITKAAEDFNDAEQNCGSGTTNVAAAAITLVAGGFVKIEASVTLAFDTLNTTISVRVRRTGDSTDTLYLSNEIAWIGGGEASFAPLLSDSPGAGSYTYTLAVISSDANVHAYNACIIVQQFKK